jgi:HD-GYP domain-containing protein (c-di-GMP phosphodiesterase class II)
VGHGGSSSPARRTDRWRARPVQSAVLRGIVLLVPLGAGVATAAVISRLVPRPLGGRQLLWWVLLFASSAVVAGLVDRVARRLLPLAVLLRLTLLFPDRAPSRYAVARTAGNTRLLEERVRMARERGIDGDPTRAAETVLALVAALGAHDRKTRGHSERVRAYTDLLAGALKISADDRDRLRWSALLHDIGKLQVSAEILNKPGKPEPHEWDSLKRHPEAGARLTGPLFPWLGEWGSAIQQHHERYDGRGYPHGLAGEDISLGGRILCVTDSFETMTAARSYKKPMSVTAARQELTRCAGSQFDPSIVRAFVSVSLGRLWWQVGPVSWVAQLPFISLRAASGTVAGAARAAAATAAKTAVGLAAIGAAGLTSLPPAGASAERPPGVHSSTSVEEARPPAAFRDGADADEQGPSGGKSGGGKSGGGKSGGGKPGGGSGGGGGGGSDGPGDTGGDPGGGDPGGGDPGGGDPGGGGPVDDVVDGVNDAADDVTDTVDDVVDGVGNTVGDVADGVGDIVDGLPGLGG